MKFIRDAYRLRMRERRAAGFRYIDRGARERLAKHFNICPDMIAKIVRRDRRRHL